MVALADGGLLPASSQKSPNDLLSPDEIERILSAYSGTSWAGQADFVVRIYERDGAASAIPILSMLVTSVSYPVVNMSGSTLQIGGVQIATLTGKDNIEIQLESYDSTDGLIKKYFEKKANAMVGKNGLVATPSKYVFFVQIIHGIRDSKQNYSKLIMCRVNQVSTSKSAEGSSELEKLSISLTQLDPFMQQ